MKKKEIISRLEILAIEEQIRIIYAVESGSRAWGFASKDSDYDIRFIYQREIKDYLCLDRPKETIDRFDDKKLDFHGWDLYKACSLLCKFNPSLVEWVFSPIIYIEQGDLIQELRKLMIQKFSAKPLGNHYLRLAKKLYMDHIQGKNKSELKTLLYILRALFCFRWIVENKTIPPVSFIKLIQSISIEGELYSLIVELVSRKKEDLEKRLFTINDKWVEFIESELRKMDNQLIQLSINRMEMDQINTLIINQLDWNFD